MMLLSKTALHIRPMRMEDLEQVQAVDRLSFSMPWPPSAYRYELKENPQSFLRVAEIRTPEDDWQIVGVIVVWLILDEAHIASIAVGPEQRGQGIGKQLLAEVLKEAIQRGLSVATLEVRAHNFSAQNLYRRFNFEVVGRRPRYYRDNNEDALIMTLKKLDSKYLNWLESEDWAGDKSS